MGKLKEFVSNTAYSLGANALNLVVSSATTLLIPILLGTNVEQYGYFQLYLFYVSYVGFFHLGLCDGVLLEEGGKAYKALDKHQYAFKFYFLCAIELVMAVIIMVVVLVGQNSSDYLFVAFAFALNLLIFLPRNFLSYVLQATNRIKQNAYITIIGRSVYLACVILIWTQKNVDYKYFVIADIVGKVFALVYAILQCKEIVINKPVGISEGIREVAKNIDIGIKLMLASVSSMVITGIVRIAIQKYWDIATYGRISLTLSVTNLVMTFISAMAIVLYPTLRRVKKETALELYGKIRDILMVLLLATLLCCFPLQYVLLRILPQYESSLAYLPILFPVCIYSAKVTLLVQTYMQVYRMEKSILFVNMAGILVTLVNTIISVVICRNLIFAVFSILLSQAFRSIFAEFVLSRAIPICIWKDEVLETLIIFAFVLSCCFVGDIFGMVVYIPIYALYCAAKVKKVRADIKYIKGL